MSFLFANTPADIDKTNPAYIEELSARSSSFQGRE